MEAPATADDVRLALAELANPANAVELHQYFKAYEGGYDEIDKLLDDVEHEHRLAGLLLLVKASRRDPEGAAAATR